MLSHQHTSFQNSDLFKLLRIGINDEFGQTGKFKELLNAYNLDSESIAKSIIDFLKK